MTPIRLGVVCDFREEAWHSMDLVADMLLDSLPKVVGSEIAATRLCPRLTRRWSRLPLLGHTDRAKLGDRLTGRLWDYPRWLKARAGDFDLFHIVDHSYAHLVRVLPAERTVVTCHDLDAVSASLSGTSSPFDPARWLSAGILEGLRRAAHVTCVSQATKDGLLKTGHFSPERVSVVYEGVHPSCSPEATSWDRTIEAQLGPEGPDILHVGSTIPRKRIDVALRVLARVRDVFGAARLLRVGGRLTPAQRALADELGVAGAIVELPFVERPALAALYRRAALVILPSEREGFGLPVVEALACGTPVLASAIPALQEIGGDAASYRPVNDIDGWAAAVVELLTERQRDPAAWERRRRACVARGSLFDWNTYAAQMADRYRSLAS